MVNSHNSTELQFMPQWPSKESKSLTLSLSVQWKTTDNTRTHTQTTDTFLKKCMWNSCLNSQTLPLTVRKTHLHTQIPFPRSTHQLCRNSSTPFIEFSSTRTCESHSDQHIPLDSPFVNLSQDMIRHCKPLPDFTCTIHLSFLLMLNNLSQHVNQRAELKF